LKVGAVILGVLAISSLKAISSHALLGADAVGSDHLSQGLCPLPAVGSVQDVNGGIEVEQAAALGAVDRDLEVRRP
jgi:hypothetical protein